MMIIKKQIVTATILAALGLGFSVANASSTNNLTQVDIKKSSSVDGIDITFYTTDLNTNTVVSRKGNNRYVVLLPNVSSDSSINPSIGGLKDIISNVNVKHVNDGIGGYTKLTLETTKPITVKTYNKKSSPLTQAQKDTKLIIAQNANTKPVTTPATKPKEGKSVTPAVAKTTTPVQNSKTTSTPVASKTTANKTTPVVNITQKISATKDVKPQVKVEPKQQSKPETLKTEKNTFIDSNYNPKMKFNSKGKRMMDLEPMVSHVPSVADEKTVVEKTSSQKNIQKTDNKNTIATEETNTNVEQSQKHNLPLWLLIAGGTILGLFIMGGILSAILGRKQKSKTRLQSFQDLSEQNRAKRQQREYSDIVNNDNLSWQEKYKLYNQKAEENKIDKTNEDMSYVTDISGLKQAILMPEESNQAKTKVEKSHNDKVRENLQAKISQMEHALSQTPRQNTPIEVPQGVQSEDDSILHTFADIKLKSFSKPMSLAQTSRDMIEKKPLSHNQSYKEGKFVKLKNSGLSVSRRKSESSILNNRDLINTANKYLTNNNGETIMNKEKENYLLSSLDEYLSILDSEESTVSTTRNTNKSSIRPQADVMNRSGVSNPMNKSENNIISGGLIVKSGYNIDSDRGIYLVNIAGGSAIVGKIKDNITILKKFNKVMDRPLQVRQEDDNVYIVRVGTYKCLVDVSENKMGTLIEI